MVLLLPSKQICYCVLLEDENHIVDWLVLGLGLLVLMANVIYIIRHGTLAEGALACMQLLTLKILPELLAFALECTTLCLVCITLHLMAQTK